MSLAVHGLVTSKPLRRVRAKWSLKNGTELDVPSVEDVVTAGPTTRWERAKQRVKSVGSPTIFVFKIIRLALVVALCIVTVVSVVRTSWAWYNIALVAAVVRSPMVPPSRRFAKLTACIQAYSVPLAVLNAFTPAATNRTFSFHLSMVLLAVCAMYAYRNIWPLLTFTLHPRDGGEGRILWAKMALAGLAGIVMPLFEPYPYVPYDPKVSPIARSDMAFS